MSLGNRLRYLREGKGLQQKQVAQALSVRQPTVSDWESGKQEPNPQHRKKLAELFGVTVADLYSAKKPRFESELFKIPVLNLEQVNKIDLDSVIPNDFAEEYLFTTEKGKNMFSLNVKTDMMEPEFVVGDYIIISTDVIAENGDFVIVQDSLANRSRFKQLRIYGDKKILHPLNSRYEDIEMNDSVHHIVGVVIAKQKKYK